MNAELYAALEAPQLPNWSSDAHGVIRVTLDEAFGKPMPDDTYERVVLECTPDTVAEYPILARMAAADACMYWRRLFEETTDNQTLALNYWFKFSAWRRLLDLLDPMDRARAEER